MTTKEVCGIELVDGPLGPYKQAYPMDWPLPEEILAFEHEDKIAVTTVDHVTAVARLGKTAHRYRKIRQSSLPEPMEGVMRGAAYEVIDASN
jgi:hypothetical protein